MPLSCVRIKMFMYPTTLNIERAHELSLTDVVYSERTA